MILSFILAYIFIYYSAPHKRKDILQQMIPISFVSAILGGLFYTIIVTAIQGNVQFGLSSLGGAIGYMSSVLIFGKLNRESVTPTLIKNFALTLPLIYSISKVGCLTKGCCGGTLFGLEIQLIEVICFAALFAICYLANLSTPATIFCSALTKFGLEFFRDGIAIPSPNQIVSVCIAIIALAIAIKFKHKTAKGVTLE